MDVNQVWPEWNEDCVLGEGSFGKVFRARRVEYGRTFYSAIKVITVPKNAQEIKHARSQGMNDADIYNYFRGVVDNLLNEISLMDSLKGAQNIVGIEDYKIIEHEGEIGWDIFIRMELLTPFDSFVSNPEFSQSDVIRLGVDLCTALEMCEQNQIIHRDIKPDNIFISRFGEYKLGDFGIARKLEGTQANLSRKGTLNYMAPEVYKSEEYGSLVDIYSLGLVLYTLLNNNRVAFLPPYPQPITYTDNEEALSKRLSGMPLPLPCNAGPSLGAVINKACAYNPYERYQTATEFKNALIYEWNLLAQSGNNQGLHSDAMQFGSNVDQRLQNTTNDMNANGRVVVDGGTSVINGNENYDYDPALGVYSNNMDAYTGTADVQIPVGYSTAKSSKLCRILSWFFAAGVLIFGIYDLLCGGDPSLGVVGVGLALMILSAARNKTAIGIGVALLPLSMLLRGWSGFWTSLANEDAMDVPAVILIVVALLMVCSGIVILAQKEVRFGGSLAIYSIILLWAMLLYAIINNKKGLSPEVDGYGLDYILYTASSVMVFLWSYGYKSDDKPHGFRKVLHILAYPAIALLAIMVSICLLMF